MKIRMQKQLDGSWLMWGTHNINSSIIKQEARLFSEEPTAEHAAAAAGAVVTGVRNKVIAAYTPQVKAGVGNDS